MRILWDLFEVEYGNKLNYSNMSPSPSGVNFVGRSGVGQGIAGRVRRLQGLPPYEAGLITVALGGASRLASFVQISPFYTAQNVAVLSPREAMPLVERLYWTMVIRANRFRYEGFGREANRTLRFLAVPETVPSWVCEDRLASAVRELAPGYVDVRLPDKADWKLFRLQDVGHLVKGSRLTKADMRPGTTVYLGASARNNSVTARVGSVAAFPAGSISIPYNGSVGHANYQPTAFAAGDDVHVLIPHETLNPLAALFICAVIRHESFRYSYGYKWTLGRMAETMLRLPADSKGQPDYGAMSRFMGQLPFAAVL